VHRIATFCAAHARWVFLVWAVLAVAGAAASTGLSDRLSTTFTLPGQSGRLLRIQPSPVQEIRVPARHELAARG
jgi:hypothetical protein